MIVRKLRLQRGWSQEHLAELTGVNVRTIQRIEREAIEFIKGIKEFYSHFGMYLIFAIVFSYAFGLDNQMILWGIIGWGIGVIIHGLNVYEVINLFGPKWEKRQIEKRLGRKLQVSFVTGPSNY